MTSRCLGPVCAALLWNWGFAVEAAESLAPDNGRLTASETSPFASIDVAIGPWADGSIPRIRAEGALTRAAWRVQGRSRTSLQLMAPLRDRLESNGFEVLYDCVSASCGGFDFRFGIDVIDPPDMIVNLRNFRYLAARHPGTGEVVALMVSRTDNAAYVQAETVAPRGVTASFTAPDEGAAMPSVATVDVAVDRSGSAATLAEHLDRDGHAILPDLAFASGSSSLENREFASLGALADYLAARPEVTIALVGHTDSVGALDTNQALSERRASAVLERLASAHGIARARMTAAGVGYLAPATANTTPEGREANRRVEVVVLPGG